MLIVVAVSFFGYSAYYLYQKQAVKLEFSSFQLEDADASVLIPDVNRFIGKSGALENLAIENPPEDILKAFEALENHPDFNFNRTFNSSVFFSFKKEKYLVVLKTGSSVSKLAQVLNDEFNAESTYSGEILKINGKDFIAQYFGNFLCISTEKFTPDAGAKVLDSGNADYIVFDKTSSTYIRHILSKNYHFKIHQEEKVKLKGRPVNTSSHVHLAPSDFDAIAFYGSSRMAEDISGFFPNSNSENFAWLDDAIMIVKKDFFELLIARQGTNRDLDLILQEQTLESSDDSLGLSYFNIGKFKILSFNSNFSWVSSISDLNNEPRFYTEFQDFNILTNSIPAMRWYLGQIQLGNLFNSKSNNLKIFEDCLPAEVHRLRLTQTDSSINCLSEICENNGQTLITNVSAFTGQSSSIKTEIVHDFGVSIVPTRLQIVKTNGSTNVLANNLSEIGLFTINGETKWKLKLSSQLVEKPQLVDFDNDGVYEFVLFQKDQVDVIDYFGKSLSGFPVKLLAESKAGLAVNYDNLFNYRLIVHQGNQVKLYDEKGKIVEGWQFKEMSGAIAGKIYHVLTEGKDIITFKDVNNQQYVLNRRGESRIEKQINFKLKNETDFVIGGMSNSLRKHGYKNGYIYTYYLLDGELDSIKVDQQVNPVKIHWEFNGGKPLMIVEEIGRLLIVDQYGYVKSEVLKPSGPNTFVGLVGDEDYGFVFADNTQNTIYLLNNFGKMLLPVAVTGSSVSVINGDLLYTFSGTNIKAYQILK